MRVPSFYIYRLLFIPKGSHIYKWYFPWSCRVEYYSFVLRLVPEQKRSSRKKRSCWQEEQRTNECLTAARLAAWFTESLLVTASRNGGISCSSSLLLSRACPSPFSLRDFPTFSVGRITTTLLRAGTTQWSSTGYSTGYHNEFTTPPSSNRYFVLAFECAGLESSIKHLFLGAKPV